MTTQLDPCTIVLFGGSGDLAMRMIYTALFSLHLEGHLHPDTKIVVAGPDDITRGKIVDRAYSKMVQLSSLAHADRDWWPFCSRISYQRISDTEGGWNGLSTMVAQLAESTKGNLLFNLSIPPASFQSTIIKIGERLLSRQDPNPTAWKRIMIEKPFGENQATAKKLNNCLKKYFEESEICRIDHYLGKSTVRNLLTLRFRNIFPKMLWSPEAVEYVQITAAETVGVEGRTEFYDRTGAIRDMVPNHMLLLATLCSMEAPAEQSWESFREAQLNLLKGLPGIRRKDVVLGQYMQSDSTNGYREDINKDSKTETYVAFRVVPTNGPLANVPIYIRTGKRMPRKLTQVIIQLKRHEGFVDGNEVGNRIYINIQPDEGVSFTLWQDTLELCPKPSVSTLRFSFSDTFGKKMPDSYTAIFLAALTGDMKLFFGGNQVDEYWRLVDPMVRIKTKKGYSPVGYEAGTWGPPSPKGWPEWHNPGRKENSR